MINFFQIVFKYLFYNILLFWINYYQLLVTIKINALNKSLLLMIYNIKSNIILILWNKIGMLLWIRNMLSFLFIINKLIGFKIEHIPNIIYLK